MFVGVCILVLLVLCWVFKKKKYWQNIIIYQLRISPIFVCVIALLGKQQLNGHKQILGFQKKPKKL